MSPFRIPWAPAVDGPTERRRQVDAFATLLLAIVAVEYWSRGIPKWNDLGPQYVGTAVLVSVLALLGIAWPRTRRSVCAVITGLHVGIIVAEFPEAANHSYLEATLCGLVALLDVRRDEEVVLLRDAARVLFAIVLFYAGLQKLLSGYWFAGQYLAFSLARPSFQPVLAPLLTADEFARLTAYGGAVGDGPYRVETPLFLLASNAVYIAEMALAPLLLWQRARVLAALAAIALIVIIEIAAREFFFGLVFLNLALLFLPSSWHGRARWPGAAALAYLLLVRLGVAPAMVFQ